MADHEALAERGPAAPAAGADTDAGTGSEGGDVGEGGRRRRRWLVPAGAGLAVAVTVALGTADWLTSTEPEQPGRAKQLCGLPTDPGAPLGRLLPRGTQDVEDRANSFQHGKGPKKQLTCAIRIDGRTALTVRLSGWEQLPEMPAGAAKQPGAHSIGMGADSLAWAGGAVVTNYCIGRSSFSQSLLVEITGDGTVDRPAESARDDFATIAKAVLTGRQQKEVCQ